MNRLSSSILVTVIIPFRDEFSELERFKANLFLKHFAIKVFFINDGSSDETEKSLRIWFPKSQYFKTEGVGMHQAISEYIQEIDTPYFMILPFDCIISDELFSEIYQLCQKQVDRVIVCRKKYSQGEHQLYLFLQNVILLRFFRLAAWTNVFILPKSDIENFKEVSKSLFLVDLELSRKLKGKTWSVTEKYVDVSYRRYINGGALRQKCINFFILASWYFRLLSAEKLLTIYKGAKR